MTRPLYLLAGGGSRRFGSDKALARVGSQTLLEHVVAAFVDVVSRVTIVAPLDRAYPHVHAKVSRITEANPGQGPLGGLAGALAHRREHEGEGWIWLAPCDQPDVEPGWYDRLETMRHVDDRAVVFCDASQRLQPLVGLYHTDVLPAATEALATQKRGLSRWLKQQHVRVVEGWPGTINCNHREELAAWLSSQKDLSP